MEFPNIINWTSRMYKKISFLKKLLTKYMGESFQD